MITGGVQTLNRIVLAVELVRHRLERGAMALEHAGLPYAVIGGNAVFLWMVRHGEGGERFTPNVDFLISRRDLPEAKAVLEATGFVADPEQHDLFRDGPYGTPRARLRLLFAGEKVRETDLTANPDVFCSTGLETFQVLDLSALVLTKLTAFRTIDQVHLLDLLDVGLIDQSWTARYPAELAARLQSLVDDPDG